MRIVKAICVKGNGFENTINYKGFIIGEIYKIYVMDSDNWESFDGYIKDPTVNRGAMSEKHFNEQFLSLEEYRNLKLKNLLKN